MKTFLATAVLAAVLTLGLNACTGVDEELVASDRDPFAKGCAAYERGDYIAALREWRPLAEQGDPGAQLEIGEMYISGKGLKDRYPNVEEGLKWIHKAAEQDYPPAQISLGMYYSLGIGVDIDQFEALIWATMLASRKPPDEYSITGAFLRDTFAEVNPDHVADANRFAREWRVAFEKKMSGSQKRRTAYRLLHRCPEAPGVASGGSWGPRAQFWPT